MILAAKRCPTLISSEMIPQRNNTKSPVQLAKVFTGLDKNYKMFEGEPKKQALASYGDFRGYLYEAPIFSIPRLYSRDVKDEIEAFLVFKP
jgi:hypothetical protein